MAAYAETTVITEPRAQRISRDLFIVTGYCNLTNYNSTLVEIDEITGKFATIHSVIVEGPSDEGYVASWDHTNKAFKMWQANYDQTTAADGPLIEVADDTDAGLFYFTVIGRN